VQSNSDVWLGLKEKENTASSRRLGGTKEKLRHKAQERRSVGCVVHFRKGKKVRKGRKEKETSLPRDEGGKTALSE